MLARYGIAGPREHEAATTGCGGRRRASALGPPVVVKRLGPAHKERDGGVVLGCLTPGRGGRRGRADRLSGARLRGPARRHRGALRRRARPAVRPARRLRRRRLARRGARRGDRLGARPARAATTRARSCARAARSHAASTRRDRHAVADVLVALGRLASHRPEIAAIDINPLRVTGGTAVALDALIVLEGDAPWISA